MVAVLGIDARNTMEEHRQPTTEDLIALFEKANKSFIKNNQDLFKSDVSERTLCGALMLEIHKEMLSDEPLYEGYYVDVEYNRNRLNDKRRMLKEIYRRGEVIRINCDLILHSRGCVPNHDNLLALEMKKAYRRKHDKDEDRVRLRVLTSPEDYSEAVGKIDSNKKCVCGYELGVYYEVDLPKKIIKVQYFRHGSEMGRAQVHELLIGTESL